MTAEPKYEYAVQSHVPLPQDRNRSSRYPFPLMKIGDSFFVETGKMEKKKIEGRATAVRASSHNWAQKNAPERKFITRIEATGFRVWRAEDREKTRKKPGPKPRKAAGPNGIQLAASTSPQ